MQLGRIVLKIRAAGTSLGANVLGAADLNAVMTNTFTPKMPIAFVIPVSEDAKENETLIDLYRRRDVIDSHIRVARIRLDRLQNHQRNIRAVISYLD
jgi:hypothetical protein